MIDTLHSLSDAELANQVKSQQNVKFCLEELQNRHSGIFNQRISGFSSIMSIKDLRENPTSFFYEVCQDFNPDKSKFSTWLAQKTTWKCCKFFKDHQKETSLITYYEEEFDEFGRYNLGQPVEDKEDYLYNFILNNIKNKIDKKIFKLKLEGYTLQEISDKVGITHEWCRIKFNKIIEKYKQSLQKELV